MTLEMTDRKGNTEGATYQDVCLTNLIWRLLQPPLRSIDPSVALFDVLLQVAHVVVLESVSLLLPI